MRIGFTIITWCIVILALTMSASAKNDSLINEQAIIRHIGTTFETRVTSDSDSVVWHVKSTSGLKLVLTKEAYDVKTQHKIMIYKFQATHKGYQYIAQSLYKDKKRIDVAFMKFLII